MNLVMSTRQLLSIWRIFSVSNFKTHMDHVIFYVSYKILSINM